VARLIREGVRVALAIALLSQVAPLRAQEPAWTAPRVEATREALQEALSRFENAARSRAYSEELRGRARSEAAAIRQRLAEGDFEVGDRVVLAIQGQPELSDTFVVALGRVLELAQVGEISLRGVLHSELEAYLTEQLDRYIREPVVHARALIRISILGSVTRPGYYLLPAETPLADALMLVGGPTPEAKANAVWIERGAERIWEGEGLQVAIREGRTIDELNLRDGDQIVVPRRSALALGGLSGALVAVSSILFALQWIL
jgi:protein involved in polysaccharide export with SLBB domain